MAATLNFLYLTPKTLALHQSSSSTLSNSQFPPSALIKPIPKLGLSLSSTTNNKNTHTQSRFVRHVAISSDLDEDMEVDDERADFSPDLKLFVGNLPFNVDSAALAGLFKQAGDVEMVEVIYDKLSGRSRGFAFVTMSSVEQAEAAAQQFDGYELEGRPLRVNSGPPPPKRENSSFRGPRENSSFRGPRENSSFRGSRGDSSFGGGRGRERTSQDNTNRLYVGNLAWSVDNLTLENLFGEQGRVKEAKVVCDRDSGRSRGFGFVTLSSPQEVNNAIERLDGMDLDGRSIRVSAAEERSTRQF